MGVELGVLFVQRLTITDLKYHATWVVALVEGNKRWVQCRRFDYHPDQAVHPGKVLSLRENRIPVPAWVAYKTAVDYAKKDKALVPPRIVLPDTLDVLVEPE